MVDAINEHKQTIFECLTIVYDHAKSSAHDLDNSGWFNDKIVHTQRKLQRKRINAGVTTLTPFVFQT